LGKYLGPETLLCVQNRIELIGSNHVLSLANSATGRVKFDYVQSATQRYDRLNHVPVANVGTSKFLQILEGVRLLLGQKGIDLTSVNKNGKNIRCSSGLRHERCIEKIGRRMMYNKERNHDVILTGSLHLGQKTANN